MKSFRIKLESKLNLELNYLDGITTISSSHLCAYIEQKRPKFDRFQ